MSRTSDIGVQLSKVQRCPALWALITRGALMGNLRYFKNYMQITPGCCSCKNVRLYCIIEENVAALFSLIYAV